MISAALIVVVFLSIFMAIRNYGPVAITTASVAGFTVYSIPALIGWRHEYRNQPRTWEQTTDEAGAVLLIAWLVVLLAITVRGRRPAVLRTWRPHFQISRASIRAALVLSIILYAMIAYFDGSLYFLEPRQKRDIAAQEIKIVWAWINATGLLLSMMGRRPAYAMFFTFAIAIVYVAGDRTIPVITICAIILTAFAGVTLREAALNAKFIAIIGIGSIVVLFGKPIYLSIKDGSFYRIFDFDIMLHAASRFEPFSTHNTTEIVIESGFTTSWFDTITRIFGQLLIVPSRFGIQSSAWSDAFTDAQVPPDIGYGIAYSYWGQAFSLGGALGVVIFAAIFIAMAMGFDGWASRTKSATRAFVMLLGATLAVYTYRNSLENLVAFYRQITLAFLAVYVLRFLIPSKRIVLYRRAGSPRAAL